MRVLFAGVAAAVLSFSQLAAPEAAAQTAAAQTAAPATQRLPLDTFVGYDTVRTVRISPNGRYLAFIRREAVGDVLAVLDRETRNVRPIQTARGDTMRIESINFKSDSRLIYTYSYRVAVTQQRGSANRTARRLDDGFIRVSHAMAANVDGSSQIMLYDPRAQNAPRWVSPRLVSPLPDDPDNVLMLVGGGELWKINVNTGAHTEVEPRSFSTLNYVVDSKGTPVLREESTAGGRGFVWQRRAPGQKDWIEIARFSGAAGANSGVAFRGLGPALNPGQVFVLARRDGQDTTGLYVYDTATGEYTETIHVEPGFDVANAIRDTDNNKILAACWLGIRFTCEPKDLDFAKYWVGLVDAMGDKVNVRLVSRAGENGELWLIQTNGPQDLGTFHLYNINTRQLSRLITARPGVNAALLPTKEVVEYTASDGKKLWGYLWLPPGYTKETARNLPTIVVPHGGPEARDEWGDDPFAMPFAANGYAVFQPNFRGGGGFGRAFVEAGHRQWGQRMQADVADGARHLISSGVTDANRICMYGWSYGGYVAFTATFVDADLYKCSVAGAGVSDLIAMLNWVRTGDDREAISGGGQGSQGISYRYWTTAIGDPERDRAMLERYSAARNVDKMRVPLLIVHGDEDQTVPIEQAQLMEQAMKRAGREVKLVTLKDVEHFYGPDQADAARLNLSESLAFFQKYIGPGVAPPAAQ